MLFRQEEQQQQQETHQIKTYKGRPRDGFCCQEKLHQVRANRTISSCTSGTHHPRTAAACCGWLLDHELFWRKCKHRHTDTQTYQKAKQHRKTHRSSINIRLGFRAHKVPFRGVFFPLGFRV